MAISAALWEKNVLASQFCSFVDVRVNSGQIKARLVVESFVSHFFGISAH